MYGRITTFRVKPGKVAEMEARASEVAPQTAKIPGLLVSHTLWRENGEGAVVGLWESKAACDAGAAKVTEIWGGLADLLDGAPNVGSYENVIRLKG